MNVVAHARAVGRRVVRAEDRQRGPHACRHLARHLHEQRRRRRAVPDASTRIAARNVEIAQRHVAQFRGGRGEVAQHPLAHELRGAVGIDRRGRRVLARESPGGNAVDRRRRREHEATHARRAAVLQQVARRAGVVAVVLERIGHRLRHDRVRREVQHRVDRMVAAGPASTRSRSPVSPTTSGVPSVALRKPVERLSRTTTRSPRSTSWRTM